MVKNSLYKKYNLAILQIMKELFKESSKLVYSIIKLVVVVVGLVVLIKEGF